MGIGWRRVVLNSSLGAWSTSYGGDQGSKSSTRTVQRHHRSTAVWRLLCLRHGRLEVGNERLHDLQRQTLPRPDQSLIQRRHKKPQRDQRVKRQGAREKTRGTQRTVHAICTAAGPLNAFKCHPLLDILSPTSYTFTDLSFDPKATTEAGGEPRT